MKRFASSLLLLLLANIAWSQPPVQVTGYQLEGVTRIDRVTFEFKYGVFLTNSGANVTRLITGHVYSLDPNVKVQFPGITGWNPIASNTTELSNQPITITVDRTKPINLQQALVWVFGSSR